MESTTEVSSANVATWLRSLGHKVHRHGVIKLGRARYAVAVELFTTESDVANRSTRWATLEFTEA